MTHIEKIRAAINRECPNGGSDALDEALAALAELERAAAEPLLWLADPVAGDYAGYASDIVSAIAPEWAIKRAQRCYYAEFRAVPLYTAPPPAPVAEIREPTPEECERIARESTVMMATSSTYEQIGRAMFDAVRAVMRGEK
jgi:hypothetical protein